LVSAVVDGADFVIFLFLFDLAKFTKSEASSVGLVSFLITGVIDSKPGSSNGKNKKSANFYFALNFRFLL
jgi:hypothetical protein